MLAEGAEHRVIGSSGDLNPAPPLFHQQFSIGEIALISTSTE
jgi:hypothetical protein